MAFWKDKKGNELNFKQFMGKWKEGIEGITMQQQLKGQLWGSWIIMIGLICGIVISIIGIHTLWWLLIILVGGAFNQSVVMLGLYQKIIMLNKLMGGFNNVKLE